MSILCAAASSCCNNGQDTASTSKKAFEPSYMDTTIRPGDDFFRYANNNWLKNNPIPDDKTMFCAFHELADENELQIRDIINEVSLDKKAEQGSVAQKIHDFYNTGMDTVNIEKRGFSELMPYFQRINEMNNLNDLAVVLAANHLDGFRGFFYFGSATDAKNSFNSIANMGQSGLGLPDRDDYFGDDESKKELHERYRKHIANMFTIIGFDDCSDKAERIFNLEKRLAGNMMTRLDRRDPLKTYHFIAKADLKAAVPVFDWETYFAQIGAPQFDSLDISHLDYIKSLNEVLTETSLDDIKDYLKWKVLSGSATTLCKALDEENFDFYAKYLYGQEVQQPRWKRIVGLTSACLGEAVGQLYVEKHFPAEAKMKMQSLVADLKTSLSGRIDQLDWMSDDTKTAAKTKLAKMNVKVGYPDKWKDYSDFNVTDESIFKNMREFSRFDKRDDISRIGKPVDREEWAMTPQTVNACYIPEWNEICFPAAILQPPFFNLAADDAINYGGIGVVIGHEMTHGFDDQGCKTDENGNLNNWWTEEDAARFNEKTKRLVALFDEFQLIGLNINGQLTLGENIADLGGLNIAYDALMLTQQGKSDTIIDGFTQAQRFFLSYATIWRTNIRDKALERNLQDDVHSPAEARVNRTLFTMPHFYEAFKINPEDKLFIELEKRAAIW